MVKIYLYEEGLDLEIELAWLFIPSALWVWNGNYTNGLNVLNHVNNYLYSQAPQIFQFHEIPWNTQQG